MAESQQVKLGDIFYIPLSEEDDVTPKGGKGCYKGALVPTDFKNIFEWLRNSDQYSPKQKKRYGWI